MQIRIFALIAFISTFLMTNVFSQEKEMEHQRDGNKLKIHQRLNLTDEQQEQADILKLAHQKEMIDLKANLEKREIEMAELKNKGNYTREEFLSKINEIISARNKIALSFANHQMDIYQLLDETQKKEWNKFSGNYTERREKRRMKMMKDFDVENE
jgi:hypothetical protein